MKFACSSNMIDGASLTEKAQKLASWGFDGISVFFDYGLRSLDVLEELLHLEERTGVVPCEFAFGDDIYGHLMDPDPDLRQASREMYRVACETVAVLGAVTEYEYEYGPQSPLPLFHPYRQMDEAQEQAFLELTEELVKPLKGSSGYLLLEGINRYESPFLNSIRDCRDFLEKAGVANTGVLADFFHMSIEENDIPNAIRYAGKWIKHIHLGDNNRLLPGYGSIPWEESFRALKEIGYDGFLNLECSTCGDPAQTLPKTLEFLRGLAE